MSRVLVKLSLNVKEVLAVKEVHVPPFLKYQLSLNKAVLLKKESPKFGKNMEKDTKHVKSEIAMVTSTKSTDGLTVMVKDTKLIVSLEQTEVLTNVTDGKIMKDVTTRCVK